MTGDFDDKWELRFFKERKNLEEWNIESHQFAETVSWVEGWESSSLKKEDDEHRYETLEQEDSRRRRVAWKKKLHSKCLPNIKDALTGARFAKWPTYTYIVCSSKS